MAKKRKKEQSLDKVSVEEVKVTPDGLLDRLVFWLKIPENFLFLTLLLVHLIAIWIFKYIPTSDGPTHIETAEIISNYSKQELYQKFFYFNKNLGANWLGHLLLVLLLKFLPPLVAEKVLISGYVILFPISVRYALSKIKVETTFLALLSFPFIFNSLFDFGFFYFCYSSVVYFFTIGFWLKQREAFTFKAAFTLSLLALLLYLTHLFSLMAASLTIAVMSIWFTLADLKKGADQQSLKRAFISRAVIPFLSFLPAVLMVLGFISNKSSYGRNLGDQKSDLLYYLLYLEPLLSYGTNDDWEGKLARLLFGVIASVFLYLIFSKLFSNSWQLLDGLFWLVPTFLLLYYLLPSEAFSGGLIKERAALYFFLVSFFWLAAQHYSKLVKTLIESLLVFISLSMLIEQHIKWTELNGYIEEYVSVTDSIEPNKIVLPITLSAYVLPDGTRVSSNIPPFIHLSSYVVWQKDLINLANFEAHSYHFPIRYRPEVDPHKLVGKEVEKNRPSSLEILSYKNSTGYEIDYVIVWGMPNDPRVMQHPAFQQIGNQLQQGYSLTYSSSRGLVKLFRRKK
ncbi:MAG: hypothetical protein JNN15_11195 [Blastocatellia bacterium]|nr:hypothetical protein [Blastocatellia bacterium]